MLKRFLLLMLLAASAAQAELQRDPGFGNAGELVVAEDSQRYTRPLLVELADRRIVVAHMSTKESPTLHVGRYLANGMPDASFGSGGVSTVAIDDLHWSTSWVSSLQVQADGGLLILVTTQEYDIVSPPIFRNTLVRLGPDGSLAPGFNGGAILPLLALDGPVEKTVMQDGSVLLLANIYARPPLSRFKAMRIRADGTPDPAFGTGGLLTAERDGAYVYDWMPLPGGGFQVLYTTPYSSSGPPQYSLWRRFRADGTLDVGFGSAGEQVITPAAGGFARNLFALPGGYQLSQGSGCALLLFGAEGQLLREFSACLGAVLIAAQPLGDKLLIVRQDYFGGTPPPGSPLMLQLMDWSGNPDPGFDGRPNGGLPGHYNDGFTVITDRDGRILIAHGDSDTIRIYRYRDVRGGPPPAAPVPASGPVALALIMLGLLLLARRRFAPG